MFLSAPRATSSRSVWAIAPIEVGVDLDYGTTGIWHVDIDCPAIRNWQSPRGHDATTILEIDRDNSTYLEWCLWEDGGWAVLNEAAAHPIRLTGWRACLRCGSASKPVEACPTCFLVGPCECPTESAELPDFRRGLLESLAACEPLALSTLTPDTSLQRLRPGLPVHRSATAFMSTTRR